MSDIYPNTRGNSTRSPSKNIRVGTHLDVIQECVKIGNIDFVIEHGMGVASTRYFHTLNCKMISYENVPKWKICNECKIQKYKELHSVIDYDVKTYKEPFKNMTSNTLVFVDGPGIERESILTYALELGALFVVEHDAETLTKEQLDIRKHLIKKYDYKMFQYIKKNPETMLYCKSQPEFVTSELYVIYD